ncbi:hypothetical protein Aci011_042 [Acinetobacter phage vB_AbaM_B09_Aci01-1]|uniref:Tail assembly chaperone n=3 Tax=Saclayvirus TaxID=2733128 RepID=A0A386KKA1_9CAUD|nr:tail assembly chaperone [Acinetobacter phage vB_AbaM_B09_Aci01-1]YP_009813265.1 tail assembly chaperone [Acinetobacter phage vB_AbaM_B09_Aci02-2]YP_009813895.1 tail assembly chaperone [Acinetobacter phage vB_AbaM_B09_Aci05]QMP18961.1 hypothetical protein FKOIJHOC_00001 [Acinetobacter phage Ab_121]QQV88741.1 putative tail assembly chaperone protein [Acinetobacter phage Liucustia]UYL86138.1 hypothetical protein [Acinetobacter phage vB_AbaM_CP14]AYD82372.1 hypothetical protein Aci05_041 [Acin
MNFGLNPKVRDFEGKDGQRVVNYDDGARIYSIKPFKGKKGTIAAAKLTKYVSESFGGVLVGVLDQIDGGTDVEKLDAVGFMISGILDGAFKSLDDPQLHEFYFSLFDEVYRDGQRIEYDDEFKLEQEYAIDLVRHIVTYNFKSVFQRLGIAALLKKKVSEE